MNVCHSKEQMIEFLDLAAKVSKEYPVVVSEFLQGAKEIEFDAVAMNGEVVEYAISEHIEFAGVHSGDRHWYSRLRRFTSRQPAVSRKSAR